MADELVVRSMPYRLGSTADSWALQLPGCGCTVRCSTPPGLGTAGKSLWGCDQTLRTWTVGETGSHTWFSSKAMLSQPCPWGEHIQDHSHTNPPSPINPAAQTLWNWNNHHLSLQPKTPAPWVPTAPIGPGSLLMPWTDSIAHVGQTTGSLPWAGVGLGLTLLGGSVGRHGPLSHHAAPLATLAHHGNGRLALVMLAPTLC